MGAGLGEADAKVIPAGRREIHAGRAINAEAGPQPHPLAPVTPNVHPSVLASCGVRAGGAQNFS